MLPTGAKDEKAVFLAWAKKVDVNERISDLSCLPSLLTERGEMPRTLSSRPAWPSKMQCMIPNTTKHPVCTLRFFERILTAPLQRETEKKKIRKTRKNRKFYCLVQMFQPSKRRPHPPCQPFSPFPVHQE